jgi:hypothetical protein
MHQPQNNNIRALCIYAESQTYTNTVYEHLCSFKKFSNYSWFYCDFRQLEKVALPFQGFAVIMIHYSVRLPFGQISPSVQTKLRKAKAKKILFIQDEYDHTNAAIKVMQNVVFDLVFTVVPAASIHKIYSKKFFPSTKFISIFTGYVPENLTSRFSQIQPPSKRALMIGYRGRKLPIRYGKLAQEKYTIGLGVRNFCLKNNIPCDIDWEENSRIYGKSWYRFILSSRAMLGTESGSNVFDWDNAIQKNIGEMLKLNPSVPEKAIYEKIVKQHEMPNLLNQISPRIFEMAAGHTAMVLFEGAYSGILEPDVHYLALKKNFKNLGQIFSRLKENKIDQMAERAFDHLVRSGKYSYQEFVKMVDGELDQLIAIKTPAGRSFDKNPASLSMRITEFPKRSAFGQQWKKYAWLFVPPRFQLFAKKCLSHRGIQKILQRT